MKWANNTREGIVLDLFAGSGTTAHAVMEANAEDGYNRKFIMVQLDEIPDTKFKGATGSFTTIADFTAERIRRAGKKYWMPTSTLNGTAMLASVS